MESLSLSNIEIISIVVGSFHVLFCIIIVYLAIKYRHEAFNGFDLRKHTQIKTIVSDLMNEKHIDNTKLREEIDLIKREKQPRVQVKFTGRGQKQH